MNKMRGYILALAMIAAGVFAAISLGQMFDFRSSQGEFALIGFLVSELGAIACIAIGVTGLYIEMFEGQHADKTNA